MITMHTGYGLSPGSLSPGSPRLAYISKNLRALRVLRARFFCVPKKAATTDCTDCTEIKAL
jgi:hypothetical protein